MLVIVAIALAALAFLTGIGVIGSGKHFEYTIRDLLNGRENAILYLWITCSTAFSLIHLTMLMHYGLTYHFSYLLPESPIWFALHSTVGALFVAAHVYINSALHNGGDREPRYLWGKAATSE